ncbi:hypothetical protein [Chenggangzhangella methanolivorans]|uniref:Uncharacterized protein n=1 Tax=Chenggangzhangella methanolivorans TaxID=1437009 RepID=A0A9E6REA6_9HYPH|nr:hypothetical protein [Chenggangzhangella methanolivorans]QZO01903.1 hypothetical protein K6K41_11555 [Chenggangzhangella methanolivorans]
MRLVASAFVFLALAAALPPRPPSSENGPSASDCGTPYAYKIMPKGIANDTLMCMFDSVRREGRDVIWKGSCSDGSANRKETVVASDAPNGLRIDFLTSGGWVGPLRFCAPRRS